MTIYFNLNNEGFFYPYLGFFPLFFASCHSIDSVIDVVIKSTINSDAIAAFFAFKACARRNIKFLLLIADIEKEIGVCERERFGDREIEGERGRDGDICRERGKKLHSIIML